MGKKFLGFFCCFLVVAVAQLEAASTVDSCPAANPPSPKFTWVIENFSKLNTEKHYSEIFSFGGFKWQVIIFPKGNNVDHLSIYLNAADSETLPYGWSINAKFSLSVINQIHNKYTVTKETQHQFSAHESALGFASFMLLRELYDPTRGFVVNDTCIVEAMLVFHLDSDYWEYSSKKDRGYIGLKHRVEATSAVEKLQVEDPLSSIFTWTIENFSRLNTKKHYSDIFLAGDYKWRILIFPKGNNIQDLSIYLDVSDSASLPCGWHRYANFSLAVINQIDNKYTVRKDTGHRFNAYESDWGFASFMPLGKLYDPSRGYIVNDKCIIEANVFAPRGVDYHTKDSNKERGCLSVKNQGDTFHMNTPYVRKPFKERQARIVEQTAAATDESKITTTKNEQNARLEVEVAQEYTLPYVVTCQSMGRINAVIDEDDEVGSHQDGSFVKGISKIAPLQRAPSRIIENEPKLDSASEQTSPHSAANIHWMKRIYRRFLVPAMDKLEKAADDVTDTLKYSYSSIASEFSRLRSSLLAENKKYQNMNKIDAAQVIQVQFSKPSDKLSEEFIHKGTEMEILKLKKQKVTDEFNAANEKVLNKTKKVQAAKLMLQLTRLDLQLAIARRDLIKAKAGDAAFVVDELSAMPKTNAEESTMFESESALVVELFAASEKVLAKAKKAQAATLFMHWAMNDLQRATAERDRIAAKARNIASTMNNLESTRLES